MALPDLLQWASATRKSGVLELERNQIFRRLQFDEGRIVACSTSDPPARLGQLLYSSGKITREHLREALERQEATGGYLGEILQDMGVLTEEDVSRQLASGAEEKVYSLFDWPDAVFRFRENVPLAPPRVPVDLSVEAILLDGLRRLEELAKIRATFHSSGVVLARTTCPVPDEVENSGMARRILGSINGERVLSEVLLHSHASEYLVLKFLYTLTRKGVVKIVEVRELGNGPVTILDPVDHETANAGKLTPEPPGPTELRAEIDVAQRLISRDEYDAALELLNACYRAHPDDGQLQHLITRAESEYVQKVREQDLAPERIPTLLLPVDTIKEDESLTAGALYLLNMIDGESDIKTILWLAPLREIEVLRALKRLLDQGIVDLREPAVV